MMHSKRWMAVIVVALSVVLLGSYGSGQAASRVAGQGPGEALPLPTGWQNLTSGQSTWYAFQYAGDKSEVLVEMGVRPTGSATFAVWSPTDVDHWIHGSAATPTGRGSADAIYGGNLTWFGRANFGGTWYVVVEPSGSAQASFELKVSGTGVTSSGTTSAAPSPTTAQTPAASAATGRQSTPAPTLAAPSATPVPAQQSSLSGYTRRTATPTRVAQDPAKAIPLPDGPQTLEPGQHIWYGFRYTGDRSQILIDLHASPAGSATFTVWSPDVLQRWGEGYYYAPTGRGTANELYGGDLIWSGGSIIHGTWYVVVEQSGTSASTYTLQVTGTAIDRTLPATPVPTPTYSLPLPKPGV